MGLPLSGVVGPGLTVNAYKAARFGATQPAQQQNFPPAPTTQYAGSGGVQPSSTAPAAPDATTTADAVTGAWAFTTPTNEDYIVCSLVAGNVSQVFYYPYELTNVQKRLQPGGGAGNVVATGPVLTFTAYVPATYTSADLIVSDISELDIDFDVTVLGSGTAQLLVDRKSAAGVYENIATCVAITGVATQGLTIGKGFPQSGTLGTATGQSAFSVSESMGDTLRIRIVVVTGTLTATLSLKAR
jgi:hypothetical protein